MSEKNAPSAISSLKDVLKRDILAILGFLGIGSIFFIAVFAPLLANGRPFFVYCDGAFSMPFIRNIFAPDSTEVTIEKIFNFILIFLPVSLLFSFVFFRKFSGLFRVCLIAVIAILIAIPFFLTQRRLDKTNWLKLSGEMKKGEFAVFAPVPYGPFQNAASPYEKPSWKHLLGTDNIGRDVFSRMLYGARVSLAVGLLATSISIIIGVILGMTAGYFSGRTDIILMRIVEIVICFPTFLLLLILMAIMMDNKCDQSILLVIAVIGITGWTGLTRLVRGEVLKQRAMPYIMSCESLGLPVWRIMLYHLLPNISGPIFVTFTFAVAGAILAESGLSFLGFGVQDPTASWGELLRQASDDPFLHWHLTLWPGLALFLAVCSFNFAGEALRKALDPRR
jgi:peptide/nickel transport system permease protein